MDKALYIAETPEGLAFGSEQKTILAHLAPVLSIAKHFLNISLSRISLRTAP